MDRTTTSEAWATVTPADLTRIVARRLPSVFFTTVFVTAAVAAVLLAWPNQYASDGLFYVRLGRGAVSLDPTRPVTYAENHLYRAARKGTIGLPDIWGCNYEIDAIEEGARASRLGCTLVTECSNRPETVRGDMAKELEQVRAICHARSSWTHLATTTTASTGLATNPARMAVRP